MDSTLHTRGRPRQNADWRRSPLAKLAAGLARTQARRAWFALGVASVLVPIPARAQVEALPPGHWAYEELEHFENRGLIVLHGMRPYARRDVSAWVTRLQQARAADRLTRVEMARLLRLEHEFVRGEHLEQASLRFDPPLLRLHEGQWHFGLDLEAITGGAGSFGNGAGSETHGTAWGRARFEAVLRHADWAAYDTRYDVLLAEEEGTRQDENTVTSRERNWRGLTSHDERAYLALAGQHLRVVVGREYAAWGMAPEDELLVSASGRSLDAVQAQLVLGRLRLASSAGWLSVGSERNYAAHRLEVDCGAVRFGVQEAAVYASPHLEPAYLFPLSFYYGNQFNERADDNVALGVDAKWSTPLGVLDGELLVDDFIYDGDPAPNRLGVRASWRRGLSMGGADLDVQLGYLALGRWVYIHRDSLTNYVAGSGDPALDPYLGHALGPDADRWQFELGIVPDVRWQLALRLQRTRRGAGNRDLSAWKPGEPYDLSFPSGPVWTEHRAAMHTRVWLSRRVAVAAVAEWATGAPAGERRVAAEIRFDP